jgi:hypothetical protein
MNDKETLYFAGLARAKKFCELNNLPMPAVTRLARTDRLYRLATCAYYRKSDGIVIMVEKCASRGYGGPAWSWPAYAVDRTPYGVIQHELGHHVDQHLSRVVEGKLEMLFSKHIYELSREEPLTGYLGTDKNPLTFFMEWFAEIFRIYVTNPDLCRELRPKFYAALLPILSPIASGKWFVVLRDEHGAPPRITDQVCTKILTLNRK